VIAKSGNSDTIVKCNVKNKLLDVLIAVFTLQFYESICCAAIKYLQQILQM